MLWVGAAQQVWFRVGDSVVLVVLAFGSAPSSIGSCSSSFCFALAVLASFGNDEPAGRSAGATLGAFLWHVH